MGSIKRDGSPSSLHQPTNVLNQQFSIPPNIIYYIKMHPPSPEIYEKLLYLCKFFYSQKDFVVPFYDTQKYEEEWITYQFKSHMKQFFDVKFMLEDISFNIWLTLCLSIFMTDSENHASAFIKKVVRCDIKELHIERQKITFEEFKFLTPTVMGLDVRDTVIVYGNGKNVSVDCIFACCPNIKRFYYKRRKNFADIFTAKAIQNLAKLIQLSSALTHFGLSTVPRDFDVEIILNLLTNRPEIEYYLDFRGPLLKAKIKNIKACVRAVLQNGIQKSPTPVIFYSSQKQMKEKQFVIYSKNVSK